MSLSSAQRKRQHPPGAGDGHDRRGQPRQTQPKRSEQSIDTGAGNIAAAVEEYIDDGFGLVLFGCGNDAEQGLACRARYRIARCPVQGLEYRHDAEGWPNGEYREPRSGHQGQHGQRETHTEFANQVRRDKHLGKQGCGLRQHIEQREVGNKLTKIIGFIEYQVGLGEINHRVRNRHHDDVATDPQQIGGFGHRDQPIHRITADRCTHDRPGL